MQIKLFGRQNMLQNVHFDGFLYTNEKPAIYTPTRVLTQRKTQNARVRSTRVTPISKIVFNHTIHFHLHFTRPFSLSVPRCREAAAKRSFQNPGDGTERLLNQKELPGQYTLYTVDNSRSRLCRNAVNVLFEPDGLQ